MASSKKKKSEARLAQGAPLSKPVLVAELAINDSGDEVSSGTGSSRGAQVQILLLLIMQLNPYTTPTTQCRGVNL